MTNIQNSREHIIQTRVSVPNNGYVGDLRDLLQHFDSYGPKAGDSDDSARLEADEDRVSLVWEENRESLPTFSDLDNFLRFITDVGMLGKWTEEISEFLPSGETCPLPDPKVLSRYIKAYRALVSSNKVKEL